MWFSRSSASIVPAAQSAAEAPWLSEMAKFEQWSKADRAFARDDSKVFRPLVFWANDGIRKRFPMHAEMARSQFSGLASEANCERTFSYSGRVLSDLRSTMSSAQLAAHVVGHTWVLSAAEIFDKYESKAQASK